MTKLLLLTSLLVLAGCSQRENRLQATLIWNKTDSFVYYNVYRSDDGSHFTHIGFSVGSQYVDRNIAEGRTYWYEIKSVNIVGLESDPSNVIKVEIPAVHPSIEVTNGTYQT